MRGVRSNPFIVLADITIALCFIFAIYAVLAAGEKVFTASTREQRKDALEAKLRQVIKDWYEAQGFTLEESTVPSADLIKVLTVPGTNRSIYFYDNASYKRISIYDPFFARSDRFLEKPEISELYRNIGSVLAHNWKQMQYVYLHGIAEKDELTGYPQSTRKRFLERNPNATRLAAKDYGLNADPSDENDLVGAVLNYEQQEWLRKISNDRAGTIYKILEQSGAIAEPGTRASGSMDPRFVIAYGTGNKLYGRPEMGVGRVDIVIFFGDKAEDAESEGSSAAN